MLPKAQIAQGKVAGATTWKHTIAAKVASARLRFPVTAQDVLWAEENLYNTNFLDRVETSIDRLKDIQKTNPPYFRQICSAIKREYGLSEEEITKVLNDPLMSKSVILISNYIQFAPGHLGVNAVNFSDAGQGKLALGIFKLSALLSQDKEFITRLDTIRTDYINADRAIEEARKYKGPDKQKRMEDALTNAENAEKAYKQAQIVLKDIAFANGKGILHIKQGSAGSYASIDKDADGTLIKAVEQSAPEKIREFNASFQEQNPNLTVQVMPPPPQAADIPSSSPSVRAPIPFPKMVEHLHRIETSLPEMHGKPHLWSVRTIDGEKWLFTRDTEEKHQLSDHDVQLVLNLQERGLKHGADMVANDEVILIRKEALEKLLTPKIPEDFMIYANALTDKQNKAGDIKDILRHFIFERKDSAVSTMLKTLLKEDKASLAKLYASPDQIYEYIVNEVPAKAKEQLAYQIEKELNLLKEAMGGFENINWKLLSQINTKTSTLLRTAGILTPEEQMERTERNKTIIPDLPPVKGKKALHSRRVMFDIKDEPVQEANTIENTLQLYDTMLSGAEEERKWTTTVEMRNSKRSTWITATKSSHDKALVKTLLEAGLSPTAVKEDKEHISFRRRELEKLIDHTPMDRNK